MIGRIQTASNSLRLKLSAFISANSENNTLNRVCFSMDHQSQSWKKLNSWELYSTISYLSYHISGSKKKNKCTKALNLLCVLTHTTWEPIKKLFSYSTDLWLDQKWVMAVLCTALLEGRIYGCSTLFKTMHCALCLGAFRTSPAMCCSKQTTFGTETN